MNYDTARVDVGASNIATEVKPLDQIANLADDAARMGDTLESFLSRINGPSPAQLASGGQTLPGSSIAAAPACVRSEISRLRNNLAMMGELVDQINRLG